MRERKRMRTWRSRHKPRVEECLVLAAGNGSRIASLSGGLPKPLVKVNGQPLLEHVMLGAHEAGIKRFVIVVGYGADTMRDWFVHHSLGGISVTVVENPEYHKDNGVSVLRGRGHLKGPFLLLMADHIFEPDTARALLRQPLPEGNVILAVDSKLDRIFDLDDATKVRRAGDHIVEIGKQITAYDGFDTGMFVCSSALFDVLESAKKNGNCSLSDGMRVLGKSGRLRAFDIGDASWQDVDTPEALAYAESIFACQSSRVPVKEAVSYVHA
jgi:1L-myo-inositol 1-phosphate cytidylyltransferase